MKSAELSRRVGRIMSTDAVFRLSLADKRSFLQAVSAARSLDEVPSHWQQVVHAGEAETKKEPKVASPEELEGRLVSHLPK